MTPKPPKGWEQRAFILIAATVLLPDEFFNEKFRRERASILKAFGKTTVARRSKGGKK